ncbi:MAG: site-2 protease family protein [Terriglobales bacterium]
MSDPTPTFPVLAHDQPYDRAPQEVWMIERPRTRWWLYILFFLLTLLSTTIVGAGLEFNYLHHQPMFSLADDVEVSVFPIEWALTRPANLLLGVPFALTLMFILFSHEMGHYLYARHYRVYATPPFFVPFPSLIGTLGAFIRIKSPIPSRAALFDIGIAGPIAGFIPACIALVVGLSMTRPIPTPKSPYIELGLPVIFQLAAYAMKLAPLSSLSLHPIAIAAWVGMFATSLNLLPGGQLDGGHIVFSISPRLHWWTSVLTVTALIPLGRYLWHGWLLWAVMLAVTWRHPNVPRYPSVSGNRRWVAAFGLLMLVLTFTRVPLTQHPDRPFWPDFRDSVQSIGHDLRDEVRHVLHKR